MPIILSLPLSHLDMVSIRAAEEMPFYRSATNVKARLPRYEDDDMIHRRLLY